VPTVEPRPEAETVPAIEDEKRTHIYMSGIGEASLVLGLISSIIATYKAAHEVYKTAGDVSGLPRKFRLAAEQVPLVLHALSLAEQNIKAKKVGQDALQSAVPVLERCKESATSVKNIFDKTIPNKDASWTERSKKAVGIKFKSDEVKGYMEEIATNITLLAQNQVFQDAAVLKDIEEAIEQLGTVADEEDRPQFIHSGAGAINAHTGTGTMKNYNNSGSGSQYNAGNQNFGDQGRGSS